MFKNKPELVTQYKKYLNAFLKKGTNKHELGFNPENLAKFEEANGNYFHLIFRCHLLWISQSIPRDFAGKGRVLIV